MRLSNWWEFKSFKLHGIYTPDRTDDQSSVDVYALCRSNGIVGILNYRGILFPKVWLVGHLVRDNGHHKAASFIWSLRKLWV